MLGELRRQSGGDGEKNAPVPARNRIPVIRLVSIHWTNWGILSQKANHYSTACLKHQFQWMLGKIFSILSA